MAITREIREEDLPELLALYQQLNPEDPVLSIDSHLTALWQDILKNPDHIILTVIEENRLVSACSLYIHQNLTRGARPFALVENVITHTAYRKKGFGKQILLDAVELARQRNCYKVMLMSGRDASTLLFYENIGFDRSKKTAFDWRLPE